MCCGGFEGGCSEYPVWNYSSCSYQCQNVSPIIVNIDGLGWDLTDAHNGVTFDFFGNGSPIQMSWTASGSTNAFLALDRARNGALDGADLFGNLTPQPPCGTGLEACNGFRALAEFDKPENGGNGNAMIDPGDAIWPSLLLWLDRNHDGIAQPGELISLPEWNRQNPTKTIGGFDLHYAPTSYVDPHGNRFRFCAKVFGPGSGRITCDVFLRALEP